MAVCGFALHKMLPALLLLINALGFVNSAAVTAPPAELVTSMPPMSLGSYTLTVTEPGPRYTETYYHNTLPITIVVVNDRQKRAQPSASELSARDVSPPVTITTTETVVDPSLQQAETITVIANGTKFVGVAVPPASKGSSIGVLIPTDPIIAAPTSSMNTATSSPLPAITSSISTIASTQLSTVFANSTSSTASASGSSDSIGVTSFVNSTSLPTKSESGMSSMATTIRSTIMVTITDTGIVTIADTNTSIMTITLTGAATGGSTATSTRYNSSIQAISSPASTSIATSQPEDKSEGGPQTQISLFMIEIFIAKIASLFGGPKLQPLYNFIPIAGQQCMTQGGNFKCCQLQPETLTSPTGSVDLYYHVVCSETLPAFCPLDQIYCCPGVDGFAGPSFDGTSPVCVPLEVPEVDPPEVDPPEVPPVSSSVETGYPLDSTNYPSTSKSFPSWATGTGEPPTETEDPSITKPATGFPPASTSGSGTITSFPITPSSSGNGQPTHSEAPDSLDTEALSELLENFSALSKCLGDWGESDVTETEYGPPMTSSRPYPSVTVSSTGPPGNGSTRSPNDYTVKCCSGHFEEEITSYPFQCKDEHKYLVSCNPQSLYYCHHLQCAKTIPGLPRPRAEAPGLTAATAILRKVSPVPDSLLTQAQNESVKTGLELHCCPNRYEKEFFRPTFHTSQWCSESRRAIANCAIGHVYGCSTWWCYRQPLRHARAETAELTAGTTIPGAILPASDNLAVSLSPKTTFAVAVIKTSTSIGQLAQPTVKPPPHDFFMQTQSECVKTNGTIECCPMRHEDHFFKDADSEVTTSCLTDADDLSVCPDKHLFCCKLYRPGVAPQFRTMCNRFQYVEGVLAMPVNPLV